MPSAQQLPDQQQREATAVADDESHTSRQTFLTTRINTSGVPRLLLFFNYRSLFECADIDNLNYEAWKEVLDAFGYTKLDFARFLSEFALKSPAEVMKALCPFTTKAEWEPLLNKRNVRLTKETAALCFTEVMPIAGVREFIIDCSRNLPTVCIFVSPFNESVARILLDKAQISSYFDHVYNYTEREYAILEALEVLNAPPPTIPSDVRHRWERDSRPQQPQDVIMSFECDVFGIETCTRYGVRPLAISYNCADDEERGATTSAVSALLAAGASLAVKDYTSMRYDYLCHLR